MPLPDLATTWVHLGLGGTAIPQPDFTGDLAWYQEYGERTATDGTEGRLVSMHTFSQPWDSWEVHMDGSELVVCTMGTITLVQEVEDREVSTTLSTGQYVINPPGVWHTADIPDGPTTALFITNAGGTNHRPR